MMFAKLRNQRISDAFNVGKSEKLESKQKWEVCLNLARKNNEGLLKKNLPRVSNSWRGKERYCRYRSAMSVMPLH